MTPEQLQAEIGRYTYKPSRKLTVEFTVAASFGAYEHAGRWYGAVLNVDWETDDARNPGQRIALHAGRMIPYLPDAHMLRCWLLGALEEIEHHELREWLRYDGELVDDPHAAGQPAAVRTRPGPDDGG